MIFLDTHVLVWLYEGLFDKFNQNTKEKIESNDLLISPMVELELNLLFEIGRISKTGVEIVRYLSAHLGMAISRIDFYRVIEESQNLNWTRDPFDRIIVANASIFQAPLITKDERILKNYALAIW